MILDEPTLLKADYQELDCNLACSESCKSSIDITNLPPMNWKKAATNRKLALNFDKIVSFEEGR